MVLTRLAKVLLCFLGIGLSPFWQESFAQDDPRAAPEVSSLKGMGRVSGTSKVSFGTREPQTDRFLNTGNGFGLSWLPPMITLLRSILLIEMLQRSQCH
jgi:hypothetical protein